MNKQLLRDFYEISLIDQKFDINLGEHEPTNCITYNIYCNLDYTYIIDMVYD